MEAKEEEKGRERCELKPVTAASRSAHPSCPPLPTSSLPERRNWIPTAVFGRGRLEGGTADISKGEAKAETGGSSSQVKGKKPSCEPGARLNPQIKGETFPQPIRCIELVAASLRTSLACPKLGSFIQRSLTPCRNASSSGHPSGDLWPCPPPTSGCWTPANLVSPRRRRRQRFYRARALCLQHLVIALNWMSLGCCTSPPERARVGYPMTPAQQDMLERLEDLIDYFLKGEDVSYDSLGRAGEKLSKLSAHSFSLFESSCSLSLGDISSFLRSIHASFDAYSKPRSKTPQSGQQDAGEPQDSEIEAADVPRPTRPEVKIPSNACQAKAVQASRIKWKLAPSFDPRPFLSDGIVRRAFEDPDFLRKPEGLWPRMAKAQVHAARDEVLALASKWDALGACQLVKKEEVRADETVGMFAVPKDDEFDRLILNPTVVNSRSYPYSRFTKTIAPGYLIALIQLAPDERLVCSSDDLCEFYYTFKVSDLRARRNAIGTPFKAEELAHLTCFDATKHKGELLVCLATLAMGDSLAVEIAQQAHVNLLKNKAGCMRPEECLLYRQPIPRGSFFELLTIDDHIGLQKLKGHSSEDGPATRDLAVFTAANKAYEDVGLTAHPGKKQRRVAHTTVLGAELDGSRGRVSAPRGRMAMLCFITSVVVQKGIVTRKLLQGLIGCWTHVLLFRRPAFSILDRAYHEGAEFHEDLVFHMSKQCRAELMVLCLVAPTFQTDTRAGTAPFVYMLDASPFGGGICRAAMPSVAVGEFWRHSEQRGFYTKLQQGAGLALRELGLEHCEAFGESEFATQSVVAPLPDKLVRSLRDNTVVFDCVELFAGVGNWSQAHARRGLRVHPGIERSAVGRGYGDLFDNQTFRDLAKLASTGAVREWHAAPPCWSFGTLRRPRLRSKRCPAGFDPADPVTTSCSSNGVHFVSCFH